MLNEIGLFCVGYINYPKSLKYNYMYIIYIKKTLFYIHDNYMNITKIVFFESCKLLSQLATRSAKCNTVGASLPTRDFYRSLGDYEKKMKNNYSLMLSDLN